MELKYDYFRLLLLKSWPYLIFASFVFIYNYFYLHQGYSPEMDEGYLMSLGKRILNGDTPYKDFYFLRTPLSIYLQAFFLWLFGQNHTIYLGRIIFVFQITTLIVLISTMYYQYVKTVELLFLLVGSYILTTLLLNFQWYSYDALFFAGLALFFLHKEKYYIAGICMFLSAMSKQNYFLLLPLIGLFLFISKYFKKQLFYFGWHQIIKISIGFILPLGLYLSYQLLNNNLYNFIDNILLLPQTITKFHIGFILFQDNARAFLTASPYLLIFTLIIYTKSNRYILIISIISIIILNYINPYEITGTVYTFISFIIFINYILLLLILFNSDRNKSFVIHDNRIKVYFIISSIIIYLAGYNYSGIRFAYMGVGLAFPFTYLVIKQYHLESKSKMFAWFFLLSICLLGYYHKQKFIYDDKSRAQLTTEYSLDKLKKITSFKERTEELKTIKAYIDQYSTDGDYLFFFSDYSAMYYLTDRKNPTKIEWYYKFEFNNEMLDESIEALNQKKPKIMFINNKAMPDGINDFVKSNYYLKDSVTNIMIYLPLDEINILK